MAELPTKEELEKLYHEKGHDALVWYAWRNTLRILPILGSLSLEEVWPDKLVENIYLILRIPIVIQQWLIAKERAQSVINTVGLEATRAVAATKDGTAVTDAEIFAAKTDFLAVSERQAAASAKIDAETARTIAIKARDIAFSKNSIVRFITDTSKLDFVRANADSACIAAERAESIAAKQAARASDAAESAAISQSIDCEAKKAVVRAKAIADEVSTAEAAAAVVRIVDVVLNDTKSAIAETMVIAARAAKIEAESVAMARNDFNWLYETDFFQDSIPLFSINKLYDKKPKKILEWESGLLGNLRQLKLEFLAEDLKNLWNGDFPESHVQNYLKEFSVAITNDPIALQLAVLGAKIEITHSVRVILLGPGGAGKSSLSDRLQGKRVEHIKQLTVGVDYLQHQSINVLDTFPDCGLDDKKLNLFLWDFGGQTIFHGLHSAFLHENCVYVLVVDSRHEQAPDEWLHQIRHLAGSQVKVLLVTNWYEKCETYQNKTRLRREFPKQFSDESFFYFSCLDKDEPDFKRFVQSLVKASLDSQKMVLKETLDVQRALDAQYKDGDTVFVRESKLRELIAANIQDAKNTDSTLNQLQQLGFLVQVEKGKSRYCLKPAWAVDNAYQLLYSPILRQANGILNLTELEQVFAGKVDEYHVEYLVSFLNERSLCIRLQDNGKYFFPDATRADEPLLVSELLNQQNKLMLRFDLPYLPLGFHARLVHKLFVPHSEVGIHDPQDIWRQGFILRAGTTSQAVVHYLLRKNVIEMVLTGDLKAFSALLREFYTHLKAVLVSPNGIRPEQIHPSVLFNQQSFSVHSGEDLVNVLAQINSYDQLFQEVRKMASTGNINVTNGQVIIGDGNIQKSHSDNTTITVTADQRQIISSVLDEMLRHKAHLSDDVLEAVYDVRKAVKADEKQPTEKSQSVLGKLWGGLRELTNIAKDMTDVGGFVVEHQAALGTAVTAAAALLS
ncbi:C-terminal of Roc, COR, domain [Thiothrix caldifontis]|uniref:C-terminal of Roc, COR, domain n=1 Tax=Thiothrix caldifontis TaxID=525918 RepID=A0A1H4DB10_9GAMM|nr:COR domain-containing protein [Thiothrix caldifontis]SEA69955.1 C-terminal of Roc, COR, domain [Thiothrix caldifontis]